MKPFVLSCCFLLSLGLIACDSKDNQNDPGQNVTADFLESHSGEFTEADFGETLSIFADGDIELKEVRQVGSEESTTVPYPTSCTYMMYGKIIAVFELFESRRTSVDKQTGESYLIPTTHIMDFVVNRVQWIGTYDSTFPDRDTERCQIFEDEMNSYGSLSYSYDLEVLSDDQLRLHTSGGGDSVGRKERTESTLDELFQRN